MRFRSPDPKLDPEKDPCRDDSCPIESLHARHARLTAEEIRQEEKKHQRRSLAQKKRWEKARKTLFPAGAKPALTPKLVIHERITARKASKLTKTRGFHFKIPPPDGLKQMLQSFSVEDIADRYDVTVGLVERWKAVVEETKFVQTRRTSKKDYVFRALRDEPQTTSEIQNIAGGSIRQVLRYLKDLARNGLAQRVEEGWRKK